MYGQILIFHQPRFPCENTRGFPFLNDQKTSPPGHARLEDAALRPGKPFPGVSVRHLHGGFFFTAREPGGKWKIQHSCHMLQDLKSLRWITIPKHNGEKQWDLIDSSIMTQTQTSMHYRFASSFIPPKQMKVLQDLPHQDDYSLKALLMIRRKTKNMQFARAFTL